VDTNRENVVSPRVYGVVGQWHIACYGLPRSRGNYASRKREGLLQKDLMKALATKEVVSLAVIAITAPVLAMGVVLAARVMVAAGNELMLLALTLCGAVVSGINGFGRRTVRAESHSRRGRGGPQSSVALTL
jgi:hypothetical protein